MPAETVSILMVGTVVEGQEVVVGDPDHMITQTDKGGVTATTIMDAMDPAFMALMVVVGEERLWGCFLDTYRHVISWACRLDKEDTPSWMLREVMIRPPNGPYP